MSDEDATPQRQRRVRDDDDDDLADSDDDGAPQPPASQRRRLLLNQRNAERRARRVSQERPRQQQPRRNSEPVRLAGEDDDMQPVRDNIMRDSEDDEDHVAAIAGGADDEEEDDGEDLMENAERDYQRIEALDTYGTEGLDDRDYDAMDVEERRAVERELNRRDAGRNRGFYDGLLDIDDGEDDEERRKRRGAFATRVSGDDEDVESDDESEPEEDLDGDDPINLEAFDVPLREWIAQDRTRREIMRKFRVFIKHFTGGNNNSHDARHRRRGNGMYEAKIRGMAAANACSLVVSYQHLMAAEPVLAYWLADAPRDMLQILAEAATRHTLSLFPAYQHIVQSQIHVRLSHVPVAESLRNLRQAHLGCLVKVSGVVTRRSAIFPQLQVAYYSCLVCQALVGPVRIDNSVDNDADMHSAAAKSHQPESCPNVNCHSSAFRLHPTQSMYRNCQRVQLQETPGSVPAGRVPRSKQVLLSDDLVDICRPGEQVDVTAVYEHAFDTVLTLKSGFPVFSTYLAANHVSKREDEQGVSNLTEHDVRQILELGRDPNIGQRIVNSIAPSIYGHETCKLALAMSLFGGVPKNVDNKHRIRGDINVLLLGDPGTSKSQLLKYAEHTAPRAVYSTGKGASAVGLTASVHKDPITREWTLEGGALVLADHGVCCIDEFDKMSENDRTSIHEAMEQQQISISKAGIVTSLQARCSVIAAANPIGGRYDSSNTLADNVELTDPILQRFDILCVLQDQVDPVADERLAQFITSSHMRAQPTRDNNGVAAVEMEAPADRPDLISQDLLRKYIQYARRNVKPVLRGNTFDREKVASLYVALRRESAASGGVPIAVRHVESIMRMAEAHAKMHLRDYVRDDDVDASVRMMLESFIMAQKFSVRRAMRRSFGKYLTTGQDRAYLLLHILQDMFRKEQMYQVIRLRQLNQSEDLLETLEVPLDELESKARERRMYNLTEFLGGEAFAEAGYVFDDRRRVIMRSLA